MDPHIMETIAKTHSAEKVALRMRIAELEAECRQLAFGYLGITPDRNTQSEAEALETERQLYDLACKHNPCSVRGQNLRKSTT